MGAVPRSDETINLDQVFRALRSRWHVVLASLLVVGVLFYAGSHLLPTKYEATATLAYEPMDLASLVDIRIFPEERQHNIQRDALVIESRTLSERVAQKLSSGATPRELKESVSARATAELAVVDVTAESSEPEMAATIANAFADEYVDLRQTRAKDIVAHARDAVGQRIEQLSAADVRSDYGLQLRQRYDELGVQLETQQGDFSVLEYAAVPTAQASPRPKLFGVIGLILGLMGGLGLVALLEALDRRIKDEAGVEREFGLPILATVPLIRGGWRKKSGARIGLGFGKGKEGLLESTRLLRSTLKLKGFGNSNKTLLVTSALPGEGKTSTAVNLALTMAFSGDRVILVDTDLRMPRVHEYLSLPNRKGLSDVLVHAAEWRDVAQPIDLRRFAEGDTLPMLANKAKETSVNLYCVTAGQLQPGAAELLDSTRLEELVEDLRIVCDYVIFDGPPLLTVADSLPLLKKVDGAILVSRLGTTMPKEAAKLRTLLVTAGANVLGTVVVGGKTRTDEHYYYYKGGPQELIGNRVLVPSKSAEKSPWGKSGTPGNGHARGVRTGPVRDKRGSRPSGGLLGWSTQVAFISDVHGNTAALSAVLADLKRRDIRQIYCLGDLVGYGAHPNEVVEIIRDREIPTILGNHDDAVAFQRADCGSYYTTGEEQRPGEVSFQFTSEIVTEQNRSWLQGLPHERVLRMEGQTLHLVHGSPRRINEYLLPNRDERTYSRIAAGEAADILVFGHTHIPWHRLVGGVLFVNVGSVGRPRDGDPRAAYTIVELSRGAKPRLEVVKLDYDLEDDAQGVVSAGLPAEPAE